MLTVKCLYLRDKPFISYTDGKNYSVTKARLNKMSLEKDKDYILLLSIVSNHLFAQVIRDEEEGHILIKENAKDNLLPLLSTFQGNRIFFKSDQEELLNSAVETAKSLQKNLICEFTNPQINKDNLPPSLLCNQYGAFHYHIASDVLVIRFENQVHFDYFCKDGSYLEGPTYNSAHSLEMLMKLQSTEVLDEDAQSLSISGSYYGLLGAIERIISEIIHASEERSSVKVIATGQLFNLEQTSEGFNQDVLEMVDSIQPHLDLVGLKEITKEYIKLEQQGD